MARRPPTTPEIEPDEVRDLTDSAVSAPDGGANESTKPTAPVTRKKRETTPPSSLESESVSLPEPAQPYDDVEDEDGPGDSQSEIIIPATVQSLPHQSRVELRLRIPKKFLWIGVPLLLLLAGGTAVWQYRWYQPFWNRYNRATVTVRVREGEQFALEGAVIRLAGHSYTSDSTGKVSVSDITAGSYQIQAELDGYDPVTRDVTLQRGENDPIFLSLTKSAAKRVGISGKAVDAVSGAPVSGARIVLAAASTTSSSDGNFHFDAVVAGQGTLTFSKSGYLTREVSVDYHESDLSVPDVALVPSGQVVFVSNRDGRRDLYVSQYDGNNQRTLFSDRGTGENYAPLLSPDGTWVAFASTRDGIRDAYGTSLVKLYVASLDGKQLLKVSDDVAPTFTPVWSANGKRLYAEGYSSAKLDQSTYRIYEPEKQTLLDVGEALGEPTFSPDGSLFAYTTSVTETQATPVPTATATPVASTASSSGIATPTPSPTPTPTPTPAPVTIRLQAIKTYNVVTGERKTLAKREQFASELRFSSDGKALAYTVVVSSAPKRYQVTLASGSEEEVGPLANGSRRYVAAPSGDRLAFVEERDGRRDLFTVNKQEQDEQRLTTLGLVSANVLPQWDPTGRYLTFAVKREGEAAIYVVALAGGEPKKVADYAE